MFAPCLNRFHNLSEYCLCTANPRAAKIEADHIRGSRAFLIERLMTLGYLSEAEIRSGTSPQGGAR